MPGVAGGGGPMSGGSSPGRSDGAGLRLASGAMTDRNSSVRRRSDGWRMRGRTRSRWPPAARGRIAIPYRFAAARVRVPGAGGIRVDVGCAGEGAWLRREYNALRPYSSLGHATPEEFGASRGGRGIAKDACPALASHVFHRREMLPPRVDQIMGRRPSLSLKSGRVATILTFVDCRPGVWRFARSSPALCSMPSVVRRPAVATKLHESIVGETTS